MSLLLSVIVLCLFSGTGLADAILAKNEVCFDTAFEAVGNAAFACDDPNNYYAGACQCDPKVVSIFAAAQRYCSDDEFNAGFRFMEETCRAYGGGLNVHPPAYYATNLTARAIARYPVLNYTAALATAEEPLDSPFVVSDDFFKAYLKTVTVWNNEMKAHWHYGYSMYGFWGGVLVIGMIYNLLSTFAYRRRAQGIDDVESSTATTQARPSLLGKANQYLNAHFLLPSSIGDYHQRLLAGCTIPTRAIGAILAIYWLLNLVLCCVTYDAFEGNLYWSTNSAQIRRYVADRTGILAYANLPWIWLFAGRNNVFIWATGWSFSTFNTFHRHVARVATIQAIAHSVAYTIDSFKYGGAAAYYADFDELYWTMGVVAVVMMSLLVGLSVVWVRRWSYEIFLISHILMAVVTIITLFYHTNIFTDHSYDGFLWPLVAIWGFDRFLRAVRLAYCNIRVGLSKNSGMFTTANVVYDAAADLIKLEVTPSALVHPKPGQHYYIYQPISWKGWENHPFTLAAWGSVSEELDSACSSPIVTDIEKDKAADFGVVSEPRDTSTTASASRRTDTTLDFWIRPFDGWTHQIRRKCLSVPSHRCEMSVLMEGPYGHHEPLHTFHSVLLIAGGTGVTAVHPYMQEHMRLVQNNQATNTRSIHLLLSAKQPTFVQRIAEHELKAVRTCKDISIDLYATRHDGHYSKNSSSSPATTDSGNSSDLDAVASDTVEKEKDGTVITKPEVAGVAPIEIHRQRPDIFAAVLGFAQANIDSGARERAAVMVCGPAGMADDARAAVKQAMKRGARIEYFEEAFAW